jgi:hypothetical protein
VKKCPAWVFLAVPAVLFFDALLLANLLPAALAWWEWVVDRILDVFF